MLIVVITGSDKGRHGALDIWSLGCCILEMATGRRPWANLDNEWAVYPQEKYNLTYRSCTTSQHRIFLLSQLQNRSPISAKTSSSAVSNETPLSVQQHSNSLKIPGSRASKKWSATPKTKKPTPQSQNKAKNNSQPASSIYRIHNFFRR